MSPRRRTLLFVFILLSLNDGFVASFPVGPVLTEYSPCAGSPPQLANPLLTVTTGNRVLPECPQKAFPTQRLNEVFSFGSYPPGLSINTVATTNYDVLPKPPFPTYSTYSPVDPSITLPLESITETLPYPVDIESVTIIENYPPVTQTIQVEGFAPTANVAEIYQTPITVQIPSVPQPPPSPFVGVASPVPEILPAQNIIQEVITTNVVPEIYPQTIETEIATATSVPVQTTLLNIPPCDVGCGFGGQQLPVTLQINMASPFPEPTLAVISQPAPNPYSSFNPSFEAPPPIIVMEKSKSKLKSILPILMLSLFDGGNSGGGGCSCSQSSAPTPVPFPIVVPINNPVITRGRSKGKGKASTDTQS